MCIRDSDSTDGLIITRNLDTPELKKYIDTYYHERKKPLANAGNGEMRFPSGNIIFDNEQGGYIATKHLLELGHRRIGCILAVSISHCPVFAAINEH